ncbi:hypothetical protein EHQ68_06215 [Leptospira congkakensis]|uniref:hypothetical protein n=1 Tax=Leptospira congkakensis TaxID=2484932 RepID=UPI0010911602|nr:hypothetical protein [Leptospira congkakensis]TGL90004.1 hypothetical protein EHQ68_06215 [Leptospira congkakensis]
MKQNLHSLAFGIRFRPNFKIEDELGSIVDEILYESNSTVFSPKNFPFTRNGINEKILINEKTGNYLLINNSNIILEIKDDTDISFEEIEKNFEKDILEIILKKRKVTAINRIGYLRRLYVEESSITQELIKKSINITERELLDFNINFSIKKPILESIAKKGINDFYTIINNITKEPGKSNFILSVDVQRNFQPLVEKYEQLKFSNFITEATKEIKSITERYTNTEVILNG